MALILHRVGVSKVVRGDATMRTVLWFYALGWWAAAVGATPVQSLAAIGEAVTAQLSSIIRRDHRDFDVSVAPLDPRLRLPRCGRPLEAVPAHGALRPGWISVQVRCRGDHPWTVYVKARVSIYRRVAVLTGDLPRGTRLQPEHVILQRRDLADLRRGYFVAVDAVVGRRLRRSLPRGYVLTPQVLASDTIVHRGEAVVIRARIGALDVRMSGHALADGSEGQRIRVRNDRSKRIVEGIVRKPGEVWVTF